MTTSITNVVSETAVPAASLLGRDVVGAAYFRDAYRAPLRRPDTSVIEIFFAVLGHHPLWMKWALIIRNRLAVACGLEAPMAAEILNVRPRTSYMVGEKIGPWPIFVLSSDELIAGHDDKHLDFRLSILREREEQGGQAGSVVISTVCTVHNWYGKVYLFFIVPFHKWGVKLLIRRAIAAGRI